MYRIFIVIIILSGCTRYYNKPLTFIPASPFSFSIQERDLQNALVLKDTIAFEGNDSFAVCGGYNFATTKETSFLKYKLHSYLIKNADTSVIDYIKVSFYDSQLYSIKLITKGQQRIDLMKKQVEKFYGKKFRHAMDEGYYTHSRFTINKIYVSFIAYKRCEEAEIQLINENIDAPEFCGTKPTFGQRLKAIFR